MGTGLRVWDVSGALVFDSAVKISRLLATINIGVSDGSQSVVWPNNQLIALPVSYSGTGLLPKITISGSTVSWAYGNAPGSARGSCTILILGY